MDDSLRTLGQRIVDAARLAVIAHLQAEQMDEMMRQQEATGGAGMRISRDGALPPLSDCPGRSRIAGGRAE